MGYYDEYRETFLEPCQISKSEFLNPLSANPIKWSNTLKQFVRKLPTNCLSVLGYFLKYALKGLMLNSIFFK